MTTTLIKGGLLCDLGRPAQVGDVLIEDGIITAVGPGRSASADRVIDASEAIVMPGLISGHTHLTSLLDRGLTENLPLEPWKFYTKHAGLSLSPEETYAVAAAGALELLRGGCTAVLDHLPLDPLRWDETTEAATTAYADSGIRAVVAPLYNDLSDAEALPLHLLDEIDRNTFTPAPTQPADYLLGKAEAFLRRWQGRNPRITPALGPSGPQRCSDDLLERTAALQRRYQVQLHTHLLETKAQALVGAHRWPAGMVDYLRQLGLLGPTTSLAHCVWLDGRDIQHLAETGAVAVHNPVSNLRLGSGIAPLPELTRAGVSVGLGVDGPGCGDGLNMFEAMKFAALLHKVYGPRGQWPSAEDVFRLATRGSAAALSIRAGQLTAGSLGDVVLLSRERTFTMPQPHLLRQLVYGELGGAVDTVLVGGEVVVEHGRITTLDERAVHREVQGVIDRIYASIADRDRRMDEGAASYWQLLDAVDTRDWPINRRAHLAGA